jgi:tyrosyl-tRNA synthetase
MSDMTLSEELQWRGFVNQTTYKDMKALDGDPITFYWGVDPSSDSMTVGNLAMAMMVRHFIAHGHKAILLVGGATGMIGDPDGKKQERDLLSLEQLAANKTAIAEQYRKVFAGQQFEIVDNYDWFKEMGYLQFLRDVGKHVPMRQMLGREFVQSRLSEDGAGISYAEFSYALIQGYDFLHLHRDKGVTLQVAGADQWGNSIAGVELIRRITGADAHVWTGPLMVNKTTGVKFGKSEDGAVWLDPAKTSPTQFYQFWINCDDAGVEDYLKIYTLLDRPKIEQVMRDFNENRASRIAQKTLAYEVTKIVHGEEIAKREVASVKSTSQRKDLGELSPEEIETLKKTLPHAQISPKSQISQNEALIDVILKVNFATSKSEAIRLIASGGVRINNEKAIATTDDDPNIVRFRDGLNLLQVGKSRFAIIEQI